MPEEEIFKLADKDVIPVDDYIFSIIGEKKTLWLALMAWVSENYKESSGSWNYYNDGKQWIFKMVFKKKTLFWSSLLRDAFRVTFYFGDKAAPLIDSSNLDDKIKEDFRNGPHYGKIRGITVKILDTHDLESVKILAGIKVKMK